MEGLATRRCVSLEEFVTFSQSCSPAARRRRCRHHVRVPAETEEGVPGFPGQRTGGHSTGQHHNARQIGRVSLGVVLAIYTRPSLVPFSECVYRLCVAKLSRVVPVRVLSISTMCSPRV